MHRKCLFLINQSQNYKKTTQNTTRVITYKIVYQDIRKCWLYLWVIFCCFPWRLCRFFITDWFSVLHYNVMCTQVLTEYSDHWAAVAQEIEWVVHWQFDPGLLLSMSWRVPEQDTEPKVAPNGQASALHGSSTAIGVCVCVWMGEEVKS